MLKCWKPIQERWTVVFDYSNGNETNNKNYSAIVKRRSVNAFSFVFNPSSSCVQCVSLCVLNTK